MKFAFFLLAAFTLNANAMCERERENGNTEVIDKCYKKEISKSDADLMKSYSGYKKTLDADGQKRLLTLQRAWIDYKIKQCDFETYDYGSIAGQIHAQCSININTKRIAEIKFMQNCGLEGGDKFCASFRPM